MLWQMGECLCVSVCTLVYCTELLSPPSSSSPTSDDVYPVRAALHAGRRLSANVLSGRQRQVQSLAAAQGAGSGVVQEHICTKAVPLYQWNAACTSIHMWPVLIWCSGGCQTPVCHSALSSLAWHYLLQRHSHTCNTNYHSVQGTQWCVLGCMADLYVLINSTS